MVRNYDHIPHPTLKNKREKSTLTNWQTPTQDTNSKLNEHLFPKQVVIQLPYLKTTLISILPIFQFQLCRTAELVCKSFFFIKIYIKPRKCDTWPYGGECDMHNKQYTVIHWHTMVKSSENISFQQKQVINNTGH